MRVLFVLPGLHRYDRGAEVAFISIAAELASGGDDITLIGSGQDRSTAPYRFLRAASIRRENFEAFPSLPLLRSEYRYEELSFVIGLLYQYSPADYDVTVTCSYPFSNWVLRRPRISGGRPPHVFVTQNGDWPPRRQNLEYRFFNCEGLICTNPEYYERHRHFWRSRLIPNGVDCTRFFPGAGQRWRFKIRQDQIVVLMVSALIPSKRVSVAIEAVSHVPGAHLVVAGDGPLRRELDMVAERLLPQRFTRLMVEPERMPELYRSADVFLHLSKDEPFGIVYLEAMACGLPIVAHESPRARYIVGDNEFLADTDDVMAIVQQIKLASVAGHRRFAERSIKAAAFSWKNIARMYREFFEEIVALKRPVRS
jgi:glycosyltransferase involved in cell wall biosynthesis